MLQKQRNYFLLHFLWLIPLQVLLAERIAIYGIIPDFFWLGLVWSLFKLPNYQTYLIAFISSIIFDALAGLPLGTSGLAYITVLVVFAIFFTYQLSFSPVRWFVLSVIGNFFIVLIINVITLLHTDYLLKHFLTKGLPSVIYTSFFAFIIAFAYKWKHKRENS